MSEVPLYCTVCSVKWRYFTSSRSYAPTENKTSMTALGCETPYKGTSLTRKGTPLRPYRRPMPMVLGWF